MAAQGPQPGSGQFVGVGGEDPRMATKEFGAKCIAAILSRMDEKATELLEQYKRGVIVVEHKGRQPPKSKL